MFVHRGSWSPERGTTSKDPMGHGAGRYSNSMAMGLQATTSMQTIHAPHGMREWAMLECECGIVVHEVSAWGGGSLAWRAACH